MRVAIVGSRDWKDLAVVARYVAKIALKYPEAVIVSGGAKGVDHTAEVAAKAAGLETLIFPAEWDKYGKSAGFKRNITIVENADIVVAFQRNNSRGTAHTIRIAQEKGRRVFIYREGVDDGGSSIIHFDRDFISDWPTESAPNGRRAPREYFDGFFATGPDPWQDIPPILQGPYRWVKARQAFDQRRMTGYSVKWKMTQRRTTLANPRDEKARAAALCQLEADKRVLDRGKRRQESTFPGVNKPKLFAKEISKARAPKQVFDHPLLGHEIWEPFACEVTEEEQWRVVGRVAVAWSLTDDIVLLDLEEGERVIYTDGVVFRTALELALS